MKAYGFTMNGKGSGDDWDSKKDADKVGKCNHHSNAIHRALRTHKKAARRAGKAIINDILNDKE